MSFTYLDHGQFNQDNTDPEKEDYFGQVPPTLPDIRSSVLPLEERERILREHFEALEAVISLGEVS